MGRRKVKKGRFLDKTGGEKELQARLDPEVNALRDRYDAELMKTINEKEVDRVSTAQGIQSADREQRLASVVDSGLAKNVALSAQFASNAVADLTTGRRVGTAANIQTDIDAAKAVSGKENIEEKGDLRKVTQDANVDLTSAMAEEKGDLAKRGALYNTASSFTKAGLRKLANPDIVPVIEDGGKINLDTEKIFEAFRSGKSTNPAVIGSLASIDYTPTDISSLQDDEASKLSFT